jgi:pimeloyl-ACP methyl ester carboxylesterase
MRILSRTPLVLLAGLSLALPAGAGRVSAADDKEVFSRVRLPTYDEMELAGTFYPSQPAAGKKDKDAVVMLLHDFGHRAGGGSHKDGWDKLAAALQKDGYSVLSFDFRGFGESTSVSPNFWKYPKNKILKGAGKANPPESISQKDFPNLYYTVLINDVAAARSFLDRKNDAREVNTSNLIVIGAGQGATLGALWMAAECRRQKDKLSDQPAIGFRLPAFDDPEGKDLAAAILLNISPTLEGRPVSRAVQSALVDVARESKVPTVFVYGKNDQTASNLSLDYLKVITTTRDGRKLELKNTGEKSIPGTELSGGKLLGDRRTIAFILKHLETVMEDRGSKEWKKRNEEKYNYVWSLPWPTASSVRRIIAKTSGEKVPRSIPADVSKLP